jgi:heme oxygenase
MPERAVILSTPLPLSQALRTSTRPRHEALERRLGLGRADWSRARYVDFLRATLAVVDALEAPHARALSGRFERGDTTRAARLRRDLARLGALADVAPLPGGPEPATTADAFGAAYVLQGSEQGAPFVAAALSRRLGLGEEDMTYLRPPTANGPDWPGFVATLDRFGQEDPRAVERTVDAGLRTFAAFERAFEREGFA